MSKKMLVVTGSTSELIRDTLTTQSDWTKCIICQLDKEDQSGRCPAKSNRACVSGYETFVSNLLEFEKLGEIPLGLDPRRLDDGEGIQTTLESHEAWWHKSCYNRFDSYHLTRAHKRKSNEQTDECSPVKTRTSIGNLSRNTIDMCFFCGKLGGKDGLHVASTKNLDVRVRKAATTLQDRALLTKLGTIDLLAQDAQYHAKCLSALYNRERKVNESTASETDHLDSELRAIILAELVSYMEETRDPDVCPVFRLVDLLTMYTVRLSQMGVHTDTPPNRTRLKETLLSMIPGLKAHSEGKHVLLMFEKDIGKGIMSACNQNVESDAIILAKAAAIVRRDMFDMEYKFSGSFSENCQDDAVPAKLKALVNMILEGPNIKDQTENDNKSAGLTIAQLLMFNSVKHHRKGGVKSRMARHMRNRETPFPIYLSLTIHAHTRSRELIDNLHSYGLCIGYNRLLTISTELGNMVSNFYNDQNMVCPPQLKSGVFTTGAMDNIDHNPSARSSKDSFHGTAISLTQHPTMTVHGEERGVTATYDNTTIGTNIRPLPSLYSEVPPAGLDVAEYTVPKVQGDVSPGSDLVIAVLVEEQKWLEKVNALHDQEPLNVTECISWAGHHATSNKIPVRPKCISALLPLFHEQAHTVAMIRHSMTLMEQDIQHLNPGQIPVFTVDQPLYALAKQTQWRWPDLYGEDRFVVVLGGLHIEMALFKVLGGWLEGSGWTSVLVQANITTSGRANSMLEGGHVTRTRWAHQVTAASLSVLQRDAYNQYTGMHPIDDIPLTFGEWCKAQSDAHPQFRYWNMTISLELLVMQFVRSLREANFKLYVESLGQLAPWFFAMDRTHYSRWVPVHIRDMTQLENTHPSVYRQFVQGNFTVQKTARAFSSMALDQNHEQLNEVIKGDGGAVGLTENPAALLRWMIAGPEIARLVNEFDEHCVGNSAKHHEQSVGVQAEFRKDVFELTGVVQDMGNPFLDDGDDLVTLDTKVVMDSSLIQTLQTIESIGQAQYEEFVQERLVQCEKPLTDTIPKNNLALFVTTPKKFQSRSQHQVASLKTNCALFSRLYISCQSRSGNLTEFFAHENQACPPSLSNMGSLRHCTKSDLVRCLQTTTPDKVVPDCDPVVDAEVLDGSAIIHMLSPKGVRTNFNEYAMSVFMPYIRRRLQNVNRLDIVWDRYIKNSLKQSVRETRGTGQRRRVMATTPLPRNWQSFLQVDSNKEELFNFLAGHIGRETPPDGKELVSTFGTGVKCTRVDKDTTQLEPCSHEEADTRIMLHVADCVAQGYGKITIRTVDTDVVVLAVSIVAKLDISELWVAFGTGKTFRYIGAHTIASNLGQYKSAALPLFHSLSGCDTVSSFAGRGKKTCWDVWRIFEPLTETLMNLAEAPSQLQLAELQTLQQFTVLLYSRTCGLLTVNEARKHLFAQGSRSMENIPPTEASLLEHCKRATYQGGYIWGQTLTLNPVLPSPSEWGWKLTEHGWLPHWTSLPDASRACHELIRCGCKKTCRGLCKCKKNELRCTELCVCQGGCTQ